MIGTTLSLALDASVPAPTHVCVYCAQTSIAELGVREVDNFLRAAVSAASGGLRTDAGFMRSACLDDRGSACLDVIQAMFHSCCPVCILNAVTQADALTKGTLAGQRGVAQLSQNEVLNTGPGVSDSHLLAEGFSLIPNSEVRSNPCNFSCFSRSDVLDHVHVDGFRAQVFEVPKNRGPRLIRLADHLPLTGPKYFHAGFAQSDDVLCDHSVVNRSCGNTPASTAEYGGCPMPAALANFTPTKPRRRPRGRRPVARRASLPESHLSIPEPMQPPQSRSDPCVREEIWLDLKSLLVQCQDRGFSLREPEILGKAEVLEPHARSGSLDEWVLCAIHDHIFADNRDVLRITGAIDQILANIHRPVSKQRVKLISANVTSWRTEVLQWADGQDASFVFVQETHLNPDKQREAMCKIGSRGWRGLPMPSHCGEQGTHGGLLALSRQRRPLTALHTCSHEGCGYQAVSCRFRSFDLVMVNIYLKNSCGPHVSPNSFLLGSLFAMLANLKSPWIVLGDWNFDMSEAMQLTVDSRVRGQFVGVNGPTLDSGGQLDYAFASQGIAPFVDVSAEWSVPFRPHCALRLSLDLAVVDICLPQLPSFPGGPCVVVQPFEASKPAPLGGMLHADPATDPLSEQWAGFSTAVELCFQLPQPMKRGRDLNIVMAPSVARKPPTQSWTGGAAGYWSRLLLWLDKQVKGILQVGMIATIERHLSTLCEFWEPDACHQEDFNRSSDLATPGQLQDGLQKVFIHRSLGCLDEVRKCVVLQFEFCRRKHHEVQGARYKQWLEGATAKGLGPLFRAVCNTEFLTDRPFRDVAVDLRPHVRRSYWVDVWSSCISGDMAAAMKSLQGFAKAQAGQLPPFELDVVVLRLSKLRVTSPGPDGWTTHMLRALPKEAVAELINFFHAAERSASLPQQWTLVRICALAKNPLVERPIGITHVCYRAWARMRWPLINAWVQKYKTRAIWDRAIPGSGSLDTAMRRLIRAETARRTNRHFVSLFLDLKNFYEHVQHHRLIEIGLREEFPPLLLHQALLLYRGMRFLDAEQVVSPGVCLTKGILQGCPFAPCLSKLALHDVLEPISRGQHATHCDLWVDDVSIDSDSDKADGAARGIHQAYVQLKRGLDQEGFEVSLSKTCFICGNPKVAKALQLRLGPDDPRIKTVTSYLGVDNAAAARRRVVKRSARYAKGAQRKKKLDALSVPSCRLRLRILKGSIWASSLYGHQAVGIPPKRMKEIRGMLSHTLGRVSLGNVEATLDLNRKFCEDPGYTLLCQHMLTCIPLIAEWVHASSIQAHQGWTASWGLLRQSQHPWKLASGPISATQAYLLENGWVADQPLSWRHPVLEVLLDDLSQLSQQGILLYHIKRHIHSKRWARISITEGGAGAEHGLDWTVHHRLLKSHKTIAHALKSLWQGGLRCGPDAFCETCKVPASMQHVLYDCKCWRNEKPPPSHWKHIRVNWPAECFWLRGLVPRMWTQVPDASYSFEVQATGIFTHSFQGGPNIIYASDATGGPTSDNRLAFVVWGIVAFEMHEGTFREIGAITGPLPREQVVFRGEAYAALELVRRVSGPLVHLTDCLGLVKRLTKTGDGSSHLDIIPELRMHRDRLDCTWVPSHLSRDQFIQRLGEPMLWQWHANARVDQLCADRARQLFPRAAISTSRWVDELAIEVNVFLGNRVRKLLVEDKTFGPRVCFKGESKQCAASQGKNNRFIKRRQRIERPAEISAEAMAHFNAKPGEPNPKPMNKKQQLEALLTDPTPLSGHRWVKGKCPTNNFSIQCATCQLYIEQTTKPHVFARKIANACLDVECPFPDIWEVDGSHSMQNKGSFWSCAKCLAIQKTGADATSNVLRRPCQGLGRRGSTRLRSPVLHPPGTGPVGASQSSLARLFSQPAQHHGKVSNPTGPGICLAPVEGQEHAPVIAPCKAVGAQAKTSQPKKKTAKTDPKQTKLRF